jgi:hypothetical protein
VSVYWRVGYRAGDGVDVPRRRVTLFSTTSERDARKTVTELNAETGTQIFYFECESGDVEHAEDE